MAKTESINKQNALKLQQKVYDTVPFSVDASQIKINFTQSSGKRGQGFEPYSSSLKEKIKQIVRNKIGEKYNELQKQLCEIDMQNEKSGILKKGWNWLKNTLGFNTDTNKIKKELKNLDKLLKELDEDSADISKIYKNFTGRDLDNNELSELLKSEAKKSQKEAVYKPVNADYSPEDQKLDREVTNGTYKRQFILNEEKDLKNQIKKELRSLGVDINQINEIMQSVTDENKDIILQMIKMKDSKGKNVFSAENLKTIVRKIKPENKDVLQKMMEMKKSDGSHLYNKDSLLKVADKVTPENKEILLKMLDMKKSDGTYTFDNNSFVKIAGKIKPENIEILAIMMEMKNSKGTCVFTGAGFINVAGTSQTEEIIAILKSKKIKTSDKTDLLKNIRDNSKLSENYLSDFKKIMNGEPIIRAFKEGSPLKEVAKKIPKGEVVTIGGKLYVNDNGSLAELNMTKEKYLELFPPIKRYSLNQKKLGDCWFVSVLADSMNDPVYRAKLYQLFRQDGNDIYIKFPGGKNEIKFPNSKVILSKDGKNVDSAAGLQMIEQAFSIHRKGEYTNNPYEDITKFSDDIDKQMEKLRGGHPIEAVLGLFGKNNIKVLTNTSKQAQFVELIKKYANDSGVLLFFETIIPSGNSENGAPVESTLDGNYDVYSKHAYEIISYDEKTDLVYIKNPWHTGLATVIPLKELKNYIRIMSAAKDKQNAA